MFGIIFSIFLFGLAPDGFWAKSDKTGCVMDNEYRPSHFDIGICVQIMKAFTAGPKIHLMAFGNTYKHFNILQVEC